MKLSLDWLGQYVDIGTVSPEDVAYKLTMATAEVEDVQAITRTVKDIVVGEVTEIEPLETSENDRTINYVTVNLGSETLKTVCGAPNVMVGMKSAFAVPGTVIAEGVTVKEQKVYDRISYGILCSPRELGWGDFHIGILSFSDTLSAGTKIANIVPETDYVIEIDNKSITHRPDLWGHYGFARELAAIFGCALKPLETADSSEWKKLDVFPLRIENLEDCPGYACLDIDGLAPAFSPISIQYRLLATGLRPINLLVDLTNYIMCELGQPMHAFDGEKVKDIIVAPFGSKGKFTTLDSADRSMIPEDLMIKDHTGQIAIAGIMGGEETEIKEDTSRILLESANFNPARIRKTSARIRLRTDASLRFEKGQPPYNMILSIKRFVKLLRDAGQKLRIRSQLTCGGNTGEEQRNLSMKKSYINNTIGMDIPQESIVSILESLGFGASLENDDLRLTIPRHRSVRDISIPNDIVEEVARIYGYGNITPSMPDVELRRYDFNTELQKHHKIRRYLSLAKGFNEVHTYSWYDDNWLKRIGYEPGETLKLKNPASENNTRMRLEIMPNLLALIEANSTHRDRFFLYEIGNVFLNEENGCKQIVNLAGIGYQSEKLGSLQDIFLSIKGTIEELFAVTGAGNCTFAVSKNTSRPWYAAGSSMDIMLNGKSIGFLGCLTGKICDVYEKGTQVVWFEFNIDELKGHTFPQAKYDAIPVFPGSWMDFSILADLASSYTGLAEILEQYSHPILRRMKFQYCFKGKGLPENKASYTFRFWLGLRERTLTGDDLTDFRSVFLSYLNKHGLELR